LNDGFHHLFLSQATEERHCTMHTYTLGLYEKAMPNTLDLPDKLAATKQAGFDCLEISIDETDEKLNRLKWSSQQKEQLVHAMWVTGTKILTMCLSGHRKYPIGSEDDQTRSRGMTIMTDAIDFAVDMGIRIIQIAGYDEYYRPSNQKTRQLFQDNLCRSTELAARKGVTLAFETMETDFMNTVEKAMQFVQLVNSPFLQIYPDLGNITNAAALSDRDVLADLAVGRGHLAAMHLKETLPGKFREIPYGTGHVRFKEAIKAARASGVHLFVGEFWHMGEPDWPRQLEAANQFLREQFL
jgi:L-ribulose-5-phosphate 3-epimerase